MQIIELDRDEFMKYRGKSGISSAFSESITEHIYSFYKANPNQKVFYRVRNTGIPSIYVSTYERFGFILEDRMTLENVDREYLLIIDPYEYNEEYIKKFCQENFPEEVSPTCFVVDKVFKDYSEFVFWTNTLESIFPNIYSLADYSKMKRSLASSQTLDERKRELYDLGLSPLDISSLIDKICADFRDGNVRTVRTLNEVERDIYLEYMANPKSVLLYEGPNTVLAGVFCAYMFYKYDICSHLDNTATKSFVSALSDLMFDPNRMLVEDQINYLKSLPEIAVMFDPEFNFSSFVYLDKSKMSCNVKLFYVDVDSVEFGDCHSAEFDIKSLPIIPIKYEYDLTTQDISQFRKVHDKLFDLISVFENRYDRNQKLFDLTNIVFVEINGTKCIAYVEDMTLNLPVVITPIGVNLPRVESILNLSDVKGLFPINIFADFNKVLTPYVKDILIAKQSIKGSPVSPRDIRAKFYKHNHPFGVLLFNFNSVGDSLINIQGYNDYLTLGLWWKEAYIYRTGLAAALSRYISLKDHRKFNKFFSVFGGPFPLFEDLLLIREEFLKDLEVAD